MGAILFLTAPGRYASITTAVQPCGDVLPATIGNVRLDAYALGAEAIACAWGYKEVIQ